TPTAGPPAIAARQRSARNRSPPGAPRSAAGAQTPGSTPPTHRAPPRRSGAWAATGSPRSSPPATREAPPTPAPARATSARGAPRDHAPTAWRRSRYTSLRPHLARFHPLDQLLRHGQVALGSHGLDVVHQDRLPERR